MHYKYIWELRQQIDKRVKENNFLFIIFLTIYSDCFTFFCPSPRTRSTSNLRVPELNERVTILFKQSVKELCKTVCLTHMTDENLGIDWHTLIIITRNKHQLKLLFIKNFNASMGLDNLKLCILTEFCESRTRDSHVKKITEVTTTWNRKEQ